MLVHKFTSLNINFGQYNKIRIYAMIGLLISEFVTYNSGLRRPMSALLPLPFPVDSY